MEHILSEIEDLLIKEGLLKRVGKKPHYKLSIHFDSLTNDFQIRIDYESELDVDRLCEFRY